MKVDNTLVIVFAIFLTHVLKGKVTQEKLELRRDNPFVRNVDFPDSVLSLGNFCEIVFLIVDCTGPSITLCHVKLGGDIIYKSRKEQRHTRI